MPPGGSSDSEKQRPETFGFDVDMVHQAERHPWSIMPDALEKRGCPSGILYSSSVQVLCAVMPAGCADRLTAGNNDHWKCFCIQVTIDSKSRRYR